MFGKSLHLETWRKIMYLKKYTLCPLIDDTLHIVANWIEGIVCLYFVRLCICLSVTPEMGLVCHWLMCLYTIETQPSLHCSLSTSGFKENVLSCGLNLLHHCRTNGPTDVMFSRNIFTSVPHKCYLFGVHNFYWNSWLPKVHNNLDLKKLRNWQSRCYVYCTDSIQEKNRRQRNMRVWAGLNWPRIQSAGRVW